MKQETSVSYEGEDFWEDRPPYGHPFPQLWHMMRQTKAIPRAQVFAEQGYISTSNKYHMISRPDREDWFEYMNQEFFYGRLDPNQKHDLYEHYCRCYTSDTLVLPNYEYHAFKKIRNQVKRRFCA